MATMNTNSPVGSLEWVAIDGEGKLNLNGKPTYTVDVVCTPEEAAPFIKQIDHFWEENKPKGAKVRKSTGYYDHSIKDDAASAAEGVNVYKKTGNIVFRFKTNVEYASGDLKEIKVFNAKGAEISLMGKKIGNGSRGRVGGTIGIYNVNPATQGTTLYLNTVQLAKLIEYKDGASFDEIEGGDFEGVDDGMGGLEETSRPRL